MRKIAYLTVFFVTLCLGLFSGENSEADNDPRDTPPLEFQIMLEVVQKKTEEGEKQFVILLGSDVIGSPDDLPPFLKKEVAAMRQKPNGKDKAVKDITIIMRADQDTKTGYIQKMILVCQQNGFEKFALRAKMPNDDTPDDDAPPTSMIIR